jgi:hypothetical protein
MSVNKLVIEVHACDLSYIGDHRQEDHNLRLAPGKNAISYLQKRRK